MKRRRDKQKRSAKALREIQQEQAYQDGLSSQFICDNEPKAISKAFAQINNPPPRKIGQ
jgi:hypothetical protein